MTEDDPSNIERETDSPELAGQPEFGEDSSGALEHNQHLDDAEVFNAIDIEPIEQQAFRRTSILSMTLFVEGGLAGIAIGLAYWLGIPLWETCRWDLREIGLGFAAAIPMIIVLFVTAHSDYGPFVRIRELLNEGLLPRLRSSKQIDLLFLALMAGTCEELLFRTVIQQYVETLTGPIWGLLLASLVFGLLHCVSLTYAILTFIAGIYLGIFWWATDRNTIAVMITHAVYDWVAFVYLIRLYRKSKNAESTALAK